MPDWGNCSRWPVLPVFKTSLALEKILLPSSKTTESGVVCFFVVWRSVVMTTEVAQRFFFSQLTTLVIYYNFLKLATFQLGVAQGVIILTRRCLSFISSSVAGWLNGLGFQQCDSRALFSNLQSSDKSKSYSKNLVWSVFGSNSLHSWMGLTLFPKFYKQTEFNDIYRTTEERLRSIIKSWHPR